MAGKTLVPKREAKTGALQTPPHGRVTPECQAELLQSMPAGVEERTEVKEEESQKEVRGEEVQGEEWDEEEPEEDGAEAEPWLKNLDELEICSVETASIGELEDHPFAVAHSTTSSRAVSDDRNGEASRTLWADLDSPKEHMGSNVWRTAFEQSEAVHEDASALTQHGWSSSRSSSGGESGTEGSPDAVQAATPDMTTATLMKGPLPSMSWVAPAATWPAVPEGWQICYAFYVVGNEPWLQNDEAQWEHEEGQEDVEAGAELAKAGRKQRRKKKASKGSRKSIVAAINAEAASMKIADEDRTTLMLRNIPNNYTRQMMLDLLDEVGLVERYNFVYMPMDFKSSAGLGYAFVNLVSHDDAVKAMEALHGFSKWKAASEKVCAVAWGSPLQGFHAHIDRYRNSPVMHAEVPEKFKPAIFEDGKQVPFPPPTRRLTAPRWKRTHLTTAQAEPSTASSQAVPGV